MSGQTISTTSLTAAELASLLHRAQGLRLEQCRLEGLDLGDASWENCIFAGCEFAACTCTDAWLHSCQFHACTFSDCNFTSAQAEYCLFSDCVLQRCLFDTASFTECTFAGAMQYRELSLAKAILQSCTGLAHGTFHACLLSSC